MTLTKILLQGICLISASIASDNPSDSSLNDVQEGINTTMYNNSNNQQTVTFYNNIYPNTNNIPFGIDLQYELSDLTYLNLNNISYMQNKHNINNTNFNKHDINNIDANYNNLLSGQKDIANKIIQNIKKDNVSIIQFEDLKAQMNKLSSQCNIIQQLENDNFNMLFKIHKTVPNNNIVLTINNKAISLREYYIKQLNLLLNQLLEISNAAIDNMKEILINTQNKAKLIFVEISEQIFPKINEIKKEYQEFPNKINYNAFMEQVYININEVCDENDLTGINNLKVISIFALFIARWCSKLSQVINPNTPSVSYYKIIDLHLANILSKFGFVDKALIDEIQNSYCKQIVSDNTIKEITKLQNIVDTTK